MKNIEKQYGYEIKPRKQHEGVEKYGSMPNLLNVMNYLRFANTSNWYDFGKFEPFLGPQKGRGKRTKLRKKIYKKSKQF